MQLAMVLGLALLAALDKGWGEERFTFLSKGVLSTSGDYMGAALGDAGEEEYLYLSRSEGPGRLFRWTGKEAQGVVLSAAIGEPGFETGAAWADYDGDGYLDLYINRYRQPKLLYRNEGEGRFVEIAGEKGLAEPGPGQGVAWADYDADGDLDLYVVNFNSSNQLYRNDGDHFAEVGAELKVDDDGQGISAAWADYDADGDLDLYVVNYGQLNRLYENPGKGKAFVEVADSLRVDDAGQGVSCAWVDYDADGYWDLSLARYDEVNRMYRSDRGKQFKEVAANLGLDDRGQGQQMAWGDYDRDGDLDVYVVNGGDERADLSRLYRNEEGRFENVTSGVGLVEAKGGGAKLGKGAIWWDVDKDGDLDLYVVNKRQESGVYRNDGIGEGNHWLEVKIESEGQKNQYGVGSEIYLRASGKLQMRQVGLSSNYLSQGGQKIFFGLKDSKIDSFLVYWPDKYQKSVYLSSANRLYEVKRGPAKLVGSKEIDFGEKGIGVTIKNIYPVTNEGEADLEIVGIYVISQDKVFRDSPKVRLPIKIPPKGKKEILYIDFQPSEQKEYRGSIEIVSNIGKYIVAVRGRGARMDKTRE